MTVPVGSRAPSIRDAREGRSTLSLVVAVHEREAGRRWLARVQPQAADADAEIILIGPGADPAWAVPGEVVAETASSAVLTPELWARGILRSNGEAVALTIAACLPAADWVPAILRALNDFPCAAAIGGVIDLDPRGNPADWALYFLRYSAYMPPMRGGATGEIAADNAVYRRAALDRHLDAWRGGFWEPSVHARFRWDGQSILLDPRIVVEHRHSLSVGAFSRQRFVHGRTFGAARFGGAPVTVRILRTLGAPAAGAALAGRVAARVLQRRHRLGFLMSSPLLVWFVACWIAGEATGYLLGPPSSAPAEGR